MEPQIYADAQTVAFGKWILGIVGIVGTFVVGYTGKELLVWALEWVSKRKRSSIQYEDVDGNGEQHYRRRSDEGIKTIIEMQKKAADAHDRTNDIMEKQSMIMARLEENQRTLLRIVESQEKNIADISTKQRNVEFQVSQLFHHRFPEAS